MADETEVIRERMEETRNDLSNKLEKLEKQVVDTVQTATSAVTDTVQTAKNVVDSVKEGVEAGVESVKESVENTVESVRETFDLSRQVDRHPWMMMGGAVAAGFVAGKLLDYAPEAVEAAHSAAESFAPTGERFAERAASTVGRTASALGSAASAVGGAAAAAGGLMNSLEKMFGPEINKVKEMALGALLGMVRDMAVQAAPETMAPQLREIFDGFTSKLGGKPVEGSVLPPRPAEEEAHNGPERRF